ncbi:thiolase family protein [Pseudonocardia sp. C8]|uniref:thiolase family protein n=1 Tax=Pseudonocardia sp. C8 TaxID=2762759 RepID=UPI00164329EB|nr:thiolase family protein [Pseudonocardia sp. C8]MBC3191177.1 thiolase family protein [Pseudonocardia sp. C8]
MTAVVTGAYEVPYSRHPDPGCSTGGLLAGAVLGAVRAAGIDLDRVDGLGLSSFTLRPDHAVDLAWRMGLTLRWLVEDPHGGASGINLLMLARRAVEAGDADCIVLVAGDRFGPADFADLVDNYNTATRDHLAPLGFGGPNAAFAQLTTRHARATGLTETDYARIPVAQRRWAGRNPGAVYRDPMTVEDYLAAPVVTTPLRRLDCVPVVSGADAIVVERDADAAGRPRARVRALAGRHNPDQQDGDGLQTGLAHVRDRLWDGAGVGPEDLDLAGVYDDYPVMALIQLADLGCVPGDDLRAFLHDRIDRAGWPLNTSGGQLSAGQAGAAGGMHFLVEAVLQLQGRAGDRQVPDARHALVTGYGMVLYRYGAMANAVVLEAGR